MLRCDEEPIHRPGQAQPFGALLVCDRAARVTHATDNARAFLAIDAADAIGRPLASVFDGASAADVAGRLAAASDGPAGLVLDARAHGGGGAPLDLTLHVRGERSFVEVERVDAAPGDAATAGPTAATASFFAQLQQSSLRLVASKSCQALCDVLCEEVRALFGYDRALVYRFDRHWHGTVVAEGTGGAYAPILGHQFPESDIPRQARDLFLRTLVRMIPDATAAMVPLLGDGASALDLSLCQLRAPARVHREYMVNMKTCASLTLTLRDDERLWGLLACHHATPRHLPARLRNAAELLVRLANSLLRERQRADGESLRRELDGKLAALCRRLEQAPSLLDGLCEPEDSNVGHLQRVDGGGAMVWLDGHSRGVGQLPPPAARARLRAWLGEHVGKDEVFATDHLSQHLPEMAAHAGCASGLVAVSLPQASDSFIAWFRPEVRREAIWAGDPNQHMSVSYDDDGKQARLHPRKSFEQFKQVVRHHSTAVAEEELEVVRALRKALTDQDLANKVANERRLRHAAEGERQRAEQATAVREHVLNIVSHDLRNPLGAIELSAQLSRRRLERQGTAPSPQEFRRLLDKMESACVRMRRLIEDILSLSKIQGGVLQLDCRPLSPAALLAQTAVMLEPAAEAHRLALVVDAAADVSDCYGDNERLMQALGNLVGNALKFTPAGGTITLSAKRDRARDAVSFSVRDTGCGISEADKVRIFEPFWQAEGEQKKRGIGLGLSIVQQIVEAHGGTLTVDSAPGAGTAFSFSCPTQETRAPSA
jgi:light-regulated signal transduction histidine kinase (bacteriophytochrome)